jgi:hypothetical protein
MTQLLGFILGTKEIKYHLTLLLCWLMAKVFIKELIASTEIADIR